MKTNWLKAFFILPALWVSTGNAEDREAAAREFFELKIRPVLASRCARCHGKAKVSGNLRLDNRDAILKGGDLGPAILPGDPEHSPLIQAIRQTGDVKMPPTGKLSDTEIADFVKWIKRGAVWPSSKPGAPDQIEAASHWAFRPLEQVSPPNDPTGWAEGDIDRFIVARLRESKLKPNALAEKRTLLRRAYFDLIGLGPTPEKIQAFLEDDSPSAYARVVDELLDSSQYGERWGRYWMDLVHYCDTGGDNADYPVPELYLYRDYIIDSFNADKPFNEFVREQIAGDILAKSGPREKYAERVIATGYLALAKSYGTLPLQHMHLRFEDAIDTLGASFLGLTLRCARCHDHKIEPISTKDYYALYAIFASTKYPWAGSSAFESANSPRINFVPLVPPADCEARVQRYRDEVSALEAELKNAQTSKKSKEEIERVTNALRTLKRPGLPVDLPCAYAVSEGESLQAAIQKKGDPLDLGEKVPAGVPRFFMPPEGIRAPNGSIGRLQLADWLVGEQNTLTVRVIVNRVWQHHFGRGIVNTPSNFGLSGEAPSHPELLDWLSRQFVESGWSIKGLHRQIMNSKAYRLSSAPSDQNAAIDPDNKFYWRYKRRRLDAEAMRDAILFVSNQLDLTRPVAQPFPPMETWKWTMNSPFRAVYPSNHRSVYLMTQRLQRHPYLELFDGPDTSTSTAVRTESNVPSQALFLLNSPFMTDSASGLAARLEAAENKPSARIRLAHLLAYAREPSEREYERGVNFISEYAREAKHTGAKSAAASHAAWISYARIILTANEFRYID